MKTKILRCLLAGGMLCAGTIAGAAEPLQLSEAQMDSVSAGAQNSWATGTASALVGTAYARSSTSAYSSGPVRTTRASALSVATGIGASATASAGSSF